MIIEEKIITTKTVNTYEDLIYFCVEAMQWSHFKQISPHIEPFFIDLFEKFKNKRVSKGKLRQICAKSDIFGSSHFQKIYWMARGYTEDEAWNIVCNNQHNRAGRARKVLEELKNTNFQAWAETRSTRPEYWIKKGYTNEEAEEIISERARTGTLEAFIKRAKGDVEKGLENFRASQQRKVDTWNKRPLEEREAINASRGLSRDKFIEKHGLKAWYDHLEKTKGLNGAAGRASKMSLKLFLPLMDKIKNNFKIDESTIYIGHEEKIEWYLKDSGRIYLYDFCIKNLKLIVEFHGECFHPNLTKIKEENYDKWQNPFGDNLYECLSKDLLKKQIAIDHGFEIIEVYSSDNIENSILTICDKIQELLNKQGAL